MVNKFVSNKAKMSGETEIDEGEEQPIKRSKKQIEVDNVVDQVMSFTKCDQNLVDYHEESEIASFYKSKSIFITGASGFVGKCLLEKLLRSCPEIKEIFILMRPKKGLDVGERVESLLKSQLFDRLRSMKDGQLQLRKIKAVRGDITRDIFGISKENIETLSSRVSIVIHSAATVKFSEPLEVAIENNIVSVENLIDFASKMNNLQALVHVSTAYSNCDLKEVGEIFYDSPFPANKLIDMVEWMKPEMIAKICPQLLGGRPNTYTLTKAIAEALLREKSKKLLSNIPIAMIRPSIVAGAFREPIKGWVDNYNGPTGVILSMMTGALQAMHAIPSYCADIVPVDMVASLIICSAHQVHKNYYKKDSHNVERFSNNIICGVAGQPNDESLKNKWTTSSEDSKNIIIFNCVSGSLNPVIWDDFARYLGPVMPEFPCNNLIRQPGSLLVSNEQLFQLYNFLNHTVFAYLGDFILKLIGSKPKLVPIQNRILKMIETLKPFTTNQWRFDSSNVSRLHDNLTTIDKDIFNFDIRQVNWQAFIRSYYIGTKLFVLKDNPQEIVNARKNLSRVCLRSRIAQIIFLLLVYFLMLRGSTIEKFTIDTLQPYITDYSLRSRGKTTLSGPILLGIGE